MYFPKANSKKVFVKKPDVLLSHEGKEVNLPYTRKNLLRGEEKATKDQPDGHDPTALNTKVGSQTEVCSMT